MTSRTTAPTGAANSHSIVAIPTSVLPSSTATATAL
jgi:hypothetical protein